MSKGHKWLPQQERKRYDEPMITRCVYCQRIAVCIDQFVDPWPKMCHK